MRRIFMMAVVALSMSSAVAWGATTVIRSGSGSPTVSRDGSGSPTVSRGGSGSPTVTPGGSASPTPPSGRTAEHRAADGRARARARQQGTAVPGRHLSGVFLFGEQRVEPAMRASQAGSITAFRLVDHTAGLGSAITVYLDSHSRARRLIAGLYSDGDGRPGVRLAVGSVASPMPGAWNAVAIRPRPVAAGSAYWIAVRGTGGALEVRERASGRCATAATAQPSRASMPLRWGRSLPGSGCRLSGFVSGRRAASGGLPPITAGPLTAAPGVGSGSSTPAPSGGGTAPSGSRTPAPLPSPVLPPVNTAAPVVSGTPVTGQTLTSTDGSWLDGPTSYSYEWEDCDSSGATCVPISGAAASTYTLTARDVAHTIRSVLIATTAGGSTSATSAPTAPVTSAGGGGGGALSGESLISQSASAYSSGTAVWPVSNMNDATYDEYRCTPTCAGILHFASPSTGDAEVSWYNDDNDFWASVSFLGDPNYNLPKTFTIDGCAASCTGTPPSAGWVHLQSISTNVFNGGEYVVNLGTGCGGSACTWVRMDVTASTGSSGNTDAAWHLDVAACTSTCDDTWLFLGDSITNNSMPHVPTSPPNFMQTINASAPAFYPSQIEGGVSYSKTCDWLGVTASGTSCPDGAPASPNMVTSALDAFPAAHFVTLDLGTNDLNGSGTNYADAATSQFEANMTTLVQDVITADRVPVVPTIPWAPTACDSSAALTNDNPATSGTPNYWITHTLYVTYPQVVHGPDLWTYVDQHQSLINTSNCPHPTTTGQNDYRTLWASTVLSEVYP
jgi:hypothetical protein